MSEVDRLIRGALAGGAEVEKEYRAAIDALCADLRAVFEKHAPVLAARIEPQIVSPGDCRDCGVNHALLRNAVLSFWGHLCASAPSCIRPGAVKSEIFWRDYIGLRDWLTEVFEDIGRAGPGGGHSR